MKRKIPEYNEFTMESNVPGIYLAGVICGGMETHKWFIENSRVHAASSSKTFKEIKSI
jgi:thioredoxin reductase (NADPH)